MDDKKLVCKADYEAAKARGKRIDDACLTLCTHVCVVAVYIEMYFAIVEGLFNTVIYVMYVLPVQILCKGYIVGCEFI